MAIEYAHRYKAHYDLVWWIPADELALVRSSLAALADRLGLRASPATGIEGAAAVVLDALRRGEPYSRWLLIYDNADQPEDISPLIPGGPGDVVITSRNNRWESTVETVEVDVFSREESTQFLSRRVTTGISDTDANALAEELGDLPLALEQAGALQAETGMSVDEYLQQLEQHANLIMNEGTSPGYPRSMTAAWMLSVSTLKKRLPQALELLQCCAFFGPDPIPRDVFRRSNRVAETRVSDVIADPILLARAIRELGRFALVKIDGRSIAVHRLIQKLLRDDLEPEARQSFRHEVHLILAAAAPSNPDDSKFWPRFGELVAHAAGSATDLGSCRDPEVRKFALNIIRYLYRSGDHKSSQAYADRFIKQWIKDSGPRDPSVLDGQRHVGNALRELGRYSEASKIIAETLEGARAVLGEENRLTLALGNSAGADLRAHGAFEAARDLDEKALALHQRVFGDTDPQTLRVMSNLALDYGLTGDTRAARDLHQRTFLLQSDDVSGDVSSAEVLDSWNCLSRAVRLCGGFAEARDVGQDALDYGREKLGPEHYLTLRTANDLCIALRRIGTVNDEALGLAQEVFEQCDRLFGPRNPDTMAAAVSLTNIQRAMGDTDAALGLAERTISRYLEVYGKEHPYYFGCLSDLALLHRVTGNAAQARQMTETALTGMEKSLRPNHLFTLAVAMNLASDLAALGEHSEARALDAQTYVRARDSLGENDPVTLGCAANLAMDLREIGENRHADELSAETMQRYTETLHDDYRESRIAASGQRVDLDFDPPPI